MTLRTHFTPLGYIKPVQSGEKQPPAGNGANTNTTFTITVNTGMLDVAFQNISAEKYAFISFVNDASQDIKHICEFHNGDPTDTAQIIPQWLDDSTYLWGGTYSTSEISLNLETTDTTLWGQSANLGAFLCEEGAQGYGTRINLGSGTFTVKNYVYTVPALEAYPYEETKLKINNQSYTGLPLMFDNKIKEGQAFCDDFNSNIFDTKAIDNAGVQASYSADTKEYTFTAPLNLYNSILSAGYTGSWIFQPVFFGGYVSKEIYNNQLIDKVVIDGREFTQFKHYPSPTPLIHLSGIFNFNTLADGFNNKGVQILDSGGTSGSKFAFISLNKDVKIEMYCNSELIISPTFTNYRV